MQSGASTSGTRRYIVARVAVDARHGRVRVGSIAQQRDEGVEVNRRELFGDSVLRRKCLVPSSREKAWRCLRPAVLYAHHRDELKASPVLVQNLRDLG